MQWSIVEAVDVRVDAPVSTHDVAFAKTILSHVSNKESIRTHTIKKTVSISFLYHS